MLYRITRHTALTSAHRPRLIESTHTTTILTRRVEDMATDNRSVIINLVDHSRRVFEIASLTKAKDSSEFKELAIAQREIERLFQKT